MAARSGSLIRSFSCATAASSRVVSIERDAERRGVSMNSAIYEPLERSFQAEDPLQICGVPSYPIRSFVYCASRSADVSTAPPRGSVCGPARAMQ
jgi:hypothetical protein